MADLQSSPVEIVVSIFQYCDGVPEAVRLASTCRYLRACFESNILAILATVTPKSYIAFEDALHAVRSPTRSFPNPQKFPFVSITFVKFLYSEVSPENHIKLKQNAMSYMSFDTLMIVSGAVDMS